MWSHKTAPTFIQVMAHNLVAPRPHLIAAELSLKQTIRWVIFSQDGYEQNMFEDHTIKITVTSFGGQCVDTTYCMGY